MNFETDGQHEPEYSFSPVERLWSVPLYIVRKLVFYIGKSSLLGVAQASELFGFRFEYTYRDRPRWNWLKDFQLPRYGVERKR